MATSKEQSVKSIREKAIELFPSYRNKGIDYSSFNKRIGFNRGANYVLNIIDKYCNEHIICNDSIQNLIEQLKR